jgi:hypothetical protein
LRSADIAYEYGHESMRYTLARAVQARRGAGSYGEQEFVAWLSHILPVNMIDGAGNLHVDLRRDGAATLFTAHTDTVHHDHGMDKNKTYNSVRVDGDFWRADGDVLGADDGAGVALLVHMIGAGVPGYYIFFRGEECGGLGSKWLAENMPDLCGEFDRAVAFDRAGYSDVITHQGRQRCCSDAFADALAAALTTEGDWFVPDATGVYTDTAELTHLIPECTNVSVGYFRQHSVHEYQNIAFLQRLAEQVVKIDWDALPTARDLGTLSDSEGYFHGLLNDAAETWGQAEDELYDALNQAIEHDTYHLLSDLLGDHCGAHVPLHELEQRPTMIQDAMDDLLAGDPAEEVLAQMATQLLNAMNTEVQ